MKTFFAAMTVGVLLGAVSVWAEDCVDEKLRIQELTQQSAQLQVNNAQLLYNAANVEKTRLEGIKKAVPPGGAQAGTNGGTSTADGATPPVTPPVQ